ncbi:MAG: DJ-1/PfpI/YhbO family deglycase/protease [Candidatus Aminicenantes bacterium]|nr:DJ-1/PfpI/YhbO family deglycase/protease [Candidatus Aminicenantes bacterium]
MAKIAAILEDMFEDVEFTKPVKKFKNAGHEVTVVSIRSGRALTGKKKGTKVKVDLSLKNTSPDDFDALLIPGGYSPDKLRAHQNAVDFVKEFMTKNKPVFSICHGPQLLITAQVLEGRKITGWKSIIQDIKNAGAEFKDQEVVVDDNLVSSRNPGDIPAFVRESLKKLK